MIRMLLLSYLLALSVYMLPQNTSKWVVTQNSSLTINGSTNINRFSCAILKYPQTDTISIHKVNDKICLTGTINLEVKNFECNNRMMTHQFRKTLKLEEFPLLSISFISLKEFPNQKANQVRGTVAIKIAGVTKRYEISYEFESRHHTLKLRGTQAVNFSDFRLTSPQRMGKLIKANDELNVVFELQIKPVD